MKICKCSVREQGGRAAPAAAETRCHMRCHGRHPWHPLGAAPGCQWEATKSPDPEMGPQWQGSSSSQGQIQWWWWVSDTVPCSQWQVQGQARTSLPGLGVCISKVHSPDTDMAVMELQVGTAMVQLSLGPGTWVWAEMKGPSWGWSGQLSPVSALTTLR